MKKLFTLSSLICCFISSTVLAQSKFTGTWNGTLDVGATLKILLHINSDASGQLSGTMDSPDQGAKGIALSNVSASGDTLTASIAAIGGKYVGVMQDATHINGNWSQSGRDFTLNIVKGETGGELVRPQTPKPPYDYISEDVIYHNADNSIQYGATITIPHGNGPFPALVLITGSGQENRDEELFGHHPFAVIADYLTKAGYVVLRVDDRGVGQSTGPVKTATSADFAQDVMTSLNYLESRKEVNKKKVGLLGHSEGGMIAPMVATQRKDVDFIILLAGPGVKVTQLMDEQTAAVLKDKGLNEQEVKAYSALNAKVMQSVINSKDTVALKHALNDDFDAWKAKTSDSIVTATTGIYDAATQQAHIEEVMHAMYTPWYRYFIAYDPKPTLEKLSCKVLAINGSKDEQVIAASNLKGIRQALVKSRSKDYEVKEIPGVNHLFQTCKACTLDEYAQLEETMSPEVLKTIGDWLDKHVK